MATMLESEFPHFDLCIDDSAWEVGWVAHLIEELCCNMGLGLVELLWWDARSGYVTLGR